MSGIAAGGDIQRGPTTKNLGRRRAAGIYGAIVTAAILDTAGGHVSTTALVISVVVTLLVYWVAEEYAEVLGDQVEGAGCPVGHTSGELCPRPGPWSPRPTHPARPGAGPACRASDLTAANVGLVAALILLTFHGWLAGPAAQMHSWHLFFATSIAAALGLVMILLKDLVLIHLH